MRAALYGWPNADDLRRSRRRAVRKVALIFLGIAGVVGGYWVLCSGLRHW